MSPGPSLLIVSYQTTSFGLKNGIVFSFSHGLGIFLYAFVTAIGIGLLITKSPILYNGIQIVGIAFLIYLSFFFNLNCDVRPHFFFLQFLARGGNLA